MGKVFNRIYNEVKKIPAGRTMTYGEIAKIVGTYPRVVGFSLHRNPDPKNIPCHRVVFADGSMSHGYLFGGPDEQRKKLVKEEVTFDNNGRVKR